MFHWFDVVQNTRGDALAGWQVGLVNVDTQDVVPIFSDENMTPIATVSGVANRAVADENGNYDFYVESGTYTLQFFNTSGVFQRAQRFVAMFGADAANTENLADVGDGKGAFLVGHIASGTGAVARTAQAKLRETMSVKDFGAVGDGTTNDAAAIQAAIDAIDALGGGTVFFPRGTYRIGTALNIPDRGIRLVGESMYSATIIKTGADCTSVVFNSASCDLCSVEELRFTNDGTTQTSGAVISFPVAGALGVVIDRVLMEDVYACVVCDLPPLSVNDVIITRCEFLRITKYGLFLKGALNWMVQNCIVSMLNGATGTAALFLDANAEGNLFQNVFFLGGEYTFRSIGNNKENRFVNVIFDGGSLSSACVYDSASIRNHFVNCWCSTQATGGRGIVIDNAAVVGFRWIEGEIIGIAQHGVVVTAAGDFHIQGGRICNYGIAAAGTYSGVTVAAGASMRFSVKNVVFAQDVDIAGNAWNGVNVNIGNYTAYQVTGNMGIGLTGALIADSGTATGAKTVSDNIA